MTCADLLLQKKPTSILSLPNEVLIRVFYGVYYTSCKYDDELERGSYKSIASAAFFPQCLVKVCQAWKNLVDSVPKFSERVMVFVDEPIVLDELAARFKASKTLFIKVFVVRKMYPDDPDVKDPTEKLAVRQIVNAMSEHIKRSEVVVFDLLHSSSLPHLTDFSGRAPKLRTLRFKCRRPTEPGEDIRVLKYLKTKYSKVLPLHCPSLQYLDLHGHVFLEAPRIPEWQESIRQLSRKHLAISHIRGVKASDFDLRDFIYELVKLGHLTKLKLSDVSLDSASCTERGSPSKIFIQNFEFEDLSRDFIQGFVAAYENHIDVSSIILTRCELGKISYISSWNLTLEDIPNADDILQFLHNWDGFSLRLINCGVYDRLLEHLGTPAPWSERFYATTLRELQITLSPQSASAISAEALRDFISNRKQHSNKEDPLSSTRLLPIHSVYISGTNVHLSAEDRKWFQDNLECFTWEMMPQKCNSPVLDGDCSLWDFSQFDDAQFDMLVPSMILDPDGSIPSSQDYIMSHDMLDDALDGIYTQESDVYSNFDEDPPPSSLSVSSQTLVA